MSGLIGWWPLSGHAGDAVDLSGFGNHGTVTGPVRGMAAPGGLQGMYFDGVDDVVDLGNTLSFGSGDFSVGGWFFTTYSGTPNRRIISDYNGVSAFYGLYVYDGKIHGYIRDSSSNTANPIGTTTVSDGFWHHAMLVRDGGNLIVYVDGVAENTVSASSVGSVDSGGSDQIGNQPADNTAVWEGGLSDIRAYGRALSATEVDALHAQGAGDYAYPPTDGTSYWPLDGDATDSWGANDGTVSGATLTTGIRGQCYDFDGVDDYILLGDSADLSGQTSHTLMGWVNPDAAAHGDIASKWDQAGNKEWLLMSLSTGKARGHVSDGTNTTAVDSNTSIITGAWNHVCQTYDGSTLRIYVNGAPDNSTAVSYTIPDTTVDAMIGNRRDGAGTYTDPMDGQIDDVRIYPYALTPAAIHQIYRYGIGGADLRAYTLTA